jgi:alkylation response protein AidB-like acyl-CoA dehydrogenase
MDLTYTPEEIAFREEVRSWLSANVPREALPPIGTGQREYLLAWQRRQYDAGWAGIAWPQDYGGRGLSLIDQAIWYEECARAGAPEAGCLFVGLNHGGPTLIACGTEEQKRFHLPRILRGEVIWCQGFSEPGAGSDLAGIKTRGDVDGDHIVVNGQKIWTSFAQLADYQELVVRTEAGSERHKGLTWMICDMKTPGITVRPIRSLDGQDHNCEVFYDNVRIPISNVVGGLGNGWATAMSTLSFERGSAFMQAQLELSQRVERLIELARTEVDPATGRALIASDAVARDLAVMRGEVNAMRAMTLMAVSRGRREEMPGPEGVMLALYYSELIQKVTRYSMDMLGSRALLREGDLAEWADDYLKHFARTIGGGTAEIRRNIIGQRVLGLPR